MAWIDWDAVIAALDCGRLPESGGEKRIVRIAASLTADHPVSLRDAIPGLDPQNLELVTTAIRHAAGQSQRISSPDIEPDVIPALMADSAVSSP
jgi:hypothetical protein